MDPGGGAASVADILASLRAGGRKIAASGASNAVRAALGLGQDTVVVMSGHQAEFWHAGILAKWFAVGAMVRSLRYAGVKAVGAWVVVDQDDNDPTALAYPAKSAAGPLHSSFHWLDRAVATAGVPTGSRPAAQPADAAAAIANAATPSAQGGLARVHAALAAHADAPSLAAQVSRATLDLLSKVEPDAPKLVYASALAGLPAFAAWVDCMRADAQACVEAYNRAAAGFPDAKIRPMGVARGGIELPLWKLAPNAPRMAVSTANIARADASSLAPRALAMTAFLRMAACDLFIHGLGGGAYDRVTDAWMGAWTRGREALGEGAALAPTCVVTATRRIAFADVSQTPTPQEVARSAWRLHAARHDPALLGDAAAAERKRELVARIRAVKAAGGNPHPHFRELHALLESVRTQHGAALADLERQAQRVRGMTAVARAVHDRTWPFPLHEVATLEELGEAVGTGVDEHMHVREISKP